MYKMKIGIITFHRAVNYGAVLQAYALQTMIQKLGADVEILDYRCSYLEDNYNPIKILGRASNIKGFLGILVKVFPSAVKKKRSFDRFLKDHLNISKERYNRNSVYQSNQVYDIFITGSDQVWNYNHTNFDKSFFLNFVNDSSKKTAYAASLGFGSLPDKYVEEYRNLLSDFRAISVREKSAQQILKDILKKEVPVMPDPVFLLDKEEWDRIIPSGQTIKDKYILVYELMPSESLFKFALKLQHETGYKIIRISTKKQKMNNVIFRGTDRPETF